MHTYNVTCVLPSGIVTQGRRPCGVTKRAAADFPSCLGAPGRSAPAGEKRLGVSGVESSRCPGHCVPPYPGTCRAALRCDPRTEAMTAAPVSPREIKERLLQAIDSHSNVSVGGRGGAGGGMSRAMVSAVEPLW